MTLSDVRRVLRETSVDHYNRTKIEFTPLEKFQVFERVLNNLLKEGTISEAQFKRWVNVY